MQSWRMRVCDTGRETPEWENGNVSHNPSDSKEGWLESGVINLKFCKKVHHRLHWRDICTHGCVTSRKVERDWSLLSVSWWYGARVIIYICSNEPVQFNYPGKMLCRALWRAWPCLTDGCDSDCVAGGLVSSAPTAWRRACRPTWTPRASRGSVSPCQRRTRASSSAAPSRGTRRSRSRPASTQSATAPSTRRASGPTERWAGLNARNLYVQDPFRPVKQSRTETWTYIRHTWWKK